MPHKWYAILGLLALLVLFAGSAQAQLEGLSDQIEIDRPTIGQPIWGDDDDEDGDFEDEVTGTWVGTGSFSVDFGCDGTYDLGPLPASDSHTFAAGGGHVVTNPANPNSNLGTWARTDNWQISSRDISYAVDATPGGSVTSIAIVTMEVNFDEDFEGATTVFGARVYLPHQDPLDPAEVPIACSLGQHDTFVKLAATE